MAGHMGNARITVLNLEVVDVDPERNILLIKGAVPGPNGGLVMVRCAVKEPEAEGGLTHIPIDVLDASGKTGSRDLPASLFEATVSVSLMHQVVVAGLAGLRAGTHSTKTRGEVRAAARSRGVRRAPAAPGRARSGRRSGSGAASRTDRSRTATRCGSTRR